VKKVHQNQIGEISKKLCSLVVDGKDALRDIYSIGLKTLIADVPDTMGPLVCERLTVKLTQGIGKSATEEIKRECLDLMNDLLKRFGHLNENEHANIMSAIFEQLRSEKAVIRKRASLCLGSLAVVSSDALLNDLVNVLLDRINEIEKTNKKNSTSQESRTLIQTIGTISRTVGYRLGKHLSRIIPLFLHFLGDSNDESTQNDAYNELRESCFPGLESFVLRCPKEVQPFVGQITKISIEFMKFDPNYTYDEDEETNMDIDEANEEDDEIYEEEEFMASDDDDSSWKVRKAAVRVIIAVITAHPHLLKDLYTNCADELIRRFKEREENVRLDIINCFTKLVETNYVFSQRSEQDKHKSGSHTTNLAGTIPLVRQNSAQGLLESRLDSILSACYAQLKTQSVKTKSAILTLLKTLIITLNGGLDKYFMKLSTFAEKTLHDKNQGLKLDTLQFLRLGYTHHLPSTVQPTVSRLLPLVTKIISEDWYKAIAEGLRVLSAMIVAMRPYDEDLHHFEESFQYQPFLQPIYQSIMLRLETMDIDFEIKECAIHSIGTLFSQCGDHLTSQLPIVLKLLQKRLENETTRTVTLKAVWSIATSHVQTLNLADFLLNSAEDLSLYLRQYSRSLKQQCLTTLDALINHHSTVLNETIVMVIVKETSALLSDSDLHLCSLSLKLLHGLLKKNVQLSCDPIYQCSYQKLILLAKSPLLQGSALTNLILVLQTLVTTGYSNFSFDSVFQNLYSGSLDYLSSSGAANLLLSPSLENSTRTVSSIATNATSTTPTTTGFSRQAISNLSKCIGGLTRENLGNKNQKAREKIIKVYSDDIQSQNDVRSQLALLCLGELGQSTDLSSHLNLKDLILNCFERNSEDVKFAAAYALGHIVIGSMNHFFPLLLQTIQSASAHTRQQYLLLMSLKETINFYASNQPTMSFNEYLSSTLPILLELNKSEEESIRNMVGECFGILTIIAPNEILPVLLDLYQKEKDNKLSLRTIANAFKSALSHHLTAQASSAISKVIETILPLLRDSDLDVKKAALLMINTAAHHNPHIIHLYIVNHVNPVLYETLQIKLERVVDLGPFKHKVSSSFRCRAEVSHYYSSRSMIICC
jgi:cullin-associated NEDD8-dissociated protein 1